ncbi:Mg-dependent DNase [Candidatus Phytoplasma luffae]|uniref:Mg-dependent DNase n=1 Tax=Loofah witches'-broom phytoplasma TaxID=35773 RepID=A0A975FIP7_LOWBP|nr:TatD family hydrolase [Candidatus Phytoplasma luffae]QTX02653.1 Mg-dependent DNase [Candidatus Phytoplasma luffae]
MLIDTHAHLNFHQFDKDLDEVIKRAFTNDVKFFIIPGVDQKTNEKAIKLAQKYPFMKAAIGIHPCYYLNENPYNIEKYLKSKQVIAVGEIGIDLYHEKKSLPIQQKNLDIQLKLAIKYNLPIILHARESFDEIYKILLPYKGQIKGVFHCLTTNLEEAYKALKLDFYIGLGGIITYEKALETHKITKIIPLNKILLETDSPYLTPSPYSKKYRNEPKFIKIIAEKIAQLKNINLKEVSEQTTKNVKTLFNLQF